ncbi:hypothetical protein [Candidatus Pantoea multigeneris]|uniref:Uncharacterized protein n=1 Tax=Candidatus Pantoea multigeneris TaxID=2608357 RepID=A0ABX0RIY0_9GAMM|nr:hypothetical protein [Pantoea multigeneris]NIF23354.1 hypothetical protein [Pantoea multigeneris]
MADWQGAIGVRAFQVGTVRSVFVRFSLGWCGWCSCVSGWHGAAGVRAFQSQMVGSAVKTP